MTNCAGCHQPDLSGQNEAQPLAGPNFMTTWGNRSTQQLFEYFSGTMPPGNANLSPDTYLSIAAFILQSNGATPGTQPFAPAATLISAVATGQVPATAAAGAQGAPVAGQAQRAAEAPDGGDPAADAARLPRAWTGSSGWTRRGRAAASGRRRRDPQAQAGDAVEPPLHGSA
jgi:hypothetical protein